MVQSVVESNIVDVVGRKQEKSDRGQKEKVHYFYLELKIPFLNES